MKNNLRLTIDLLPKGAWGNNFSRTLPKKDWDKIRNHCYVKFDNQCAICGYSESKLDAHEVWDFDLKNRVQTLMGITALCSACHGVKHIRNSERIGYGENAKRHFMRVNRCNEMDFAGPMRKHNSYLMKETKS
ncbi:MAG: HNH endonuclease [Firmicutes bacterium]|nr:HNH endonuclease [Bacillota bacterium]MCL2256298.1 HNH endonuclease [Bacillota bacterium]